MGIKNTSYIVAHKLKKVELTLQVVTPLPFQMITKMTIVPEPRYPVTMEGDNNSS